MLKSKSKAFTVVELVVVIAVIAVLAAVLIPVFSNVVDSARQSVALSECRNALEEYISITLGQGDSDNEDLSGCAFSHNGYFYVYLNGQLHFAGRANESDTLVPVTQDSLEGIVLDGFEITKTGNEFSSQLLVAIRDGAKAFDLDRLQEEGFCLYFYNLTADEVGYAGYFVMSTSGDSRYAVNGVDYSSVAGYSRYPLEIKGEEGTTVTDYSPVKVVVQSPEQTKTLSDISAVYNGGSVWDNSSYTVNARFSDGSREQVYDFVIENTQKTDEGYDVTITYTYEGIVATIKISAGVDKTGIEIVLKENVSPVVLKHNEQLTDVSEITDRYTVMYTYSDGSTSQVNESEISLFTYSETVGEDSGSVTVTADGFSATVSGLTVVKTLQSLSAQYIGEPIAAGGAIDIANVKVTAFYSDGSDNEVSDFVIGEFDSATPGEKNVTVSYTENGLSVCCEISVTVEEQTVTLYFYNFARWSEPRAVLGCEVAENVSQKDGAEMSLIEGNWYSVQADYGCKTVVFISGTGEFYRTDLLTVDTERPYFAVTDWQSDWNVSDIAVLDITDSEGVWTAGSSVYEIALFSWTGAEQQSFVLQPVAGNENGYRYYAIKLAENILESAVKYKMRQKDSSDGSVMRITSEISLQLLYCDIDGFNATAREV